MRFRVVAVSAAAGLVFIPITFWEQRIKAEKARKWRAERAAWGVEEKAQTLAPGQVHPRESH